MDEMLTKILGFRWQRETLDFKSFPKADNLNHAIFKVKKLLSQFVWDITVLEDNPFTYVEVKTLLEGVTVGGHTVSDEQQVLNQAESWKKLLELVQNDQFHLTQEVFCLLNAIVAHKESLEWGVFRKTAVTIAGTNYKPAVADQLSKIFNQGILALQQLDPAVENTAIEKAMAFFLFGSLHQFFYDGNKRTARLMMNGELLIRGYHAISIPAQKKLEFNEKMIRFYNTQEGTEMMNFLLNCV